MRDQDEVHSLCKWIGEMKFNRELKVEVSEVSPRLSSIHVNIQGEIDGRDLPRLISMLQEINKQVQRAK